MEIGILPLDTLFDASAVSDVVNKIMSIAGESPGPWGKPNEWGKPVHGGKILFFGKSPSVEQPW